ncbi:MAG TPA: hypothetical protein VHB25_11940 [Gemmatimonadaceae bacterium]|nr:hypothetical protein [Gemmatimonadaceae bacterium]
MRWRKLGRVFAPDGARPWARSYAHLPTPYLLDDRTIRVYFAGLDDEQVGRVGYVDVDAHDPLRIIASSDDPVLDIGAPGLFDDAGVNPSCLVPVDGGVRMYYIGWQRGWRTPYMLFAGIAESPSASGDAFTRARCTPVLDRTNAEPFLRSAVSVLRTEPERWRAWYVCGTGWGAGPDGRYPSYVIRTVESRDGVHWPAAGITCIESETPDEFGFGRPWVVRDGETYRMWYSIRSTARAYRIGYAESADGRTWTRRDDDAGIAASASGWDSEMICYPAVIDAGGARYMFHNGNKHGASGFGVAVLEQE